MKLKAASLEFKKQRPLFFSPDGNELFCISFKMQKAECTAGLSVVIGTTVPLLILSKKLGGYFYQVIEQVSV